MLSRPAELGVAVGYRLTFGTGFVLSYRPVRLRSSLLDPA